MCTSEVIFRVTILSTPLDAPPPKNGSFTFIYTNFGKPSKTKRAAHGKAARSHH